MADIDPFRPTVTIVDPEDQLPLIQAFPKMLYHTEIGRRVVNSQDEQDAVMAHPGWSDVPPETQPKA